MTEKMTDVSGPTAGLLEIGHVTRAEALAAYQSFYKHQLIEATQALADLESGLVRVHHQRGVYVAHDRREVAE